MEEAGANESDELRRLRAELHADQEEIARLREEAAADARTIGDLRKSASHDAQELDHLHEEAAQAERIEAAQRALIGELRAELGDAARATEDVGERLLEAERELVDLRAIRDALIEPSLVQRKGMTIAAEVIPAAPHVAGDFFFVGDGPDGTAVIAVGDVVGKGLSAVRRSAFVRTVLASVAPFSDDPCQLLGWANTALVERVGETAEFVTAACLTYDPDSRVLRLASAGHPPPLRLESGAELAAENIAVALGLTRKINCAASVERLDTGDGLLLYTDGLIEAKGVAERYGPGRLANALRAGSHLPPPRTLELLKRDLREFAGEHLSDDVCLLVLRTT